MGALVILQHNCRRLVSCGWRNIYHNYWCIWELSEIVRIDGKDPKDMMPMIAIVVVIMILLIGYAFLGIVEMGKKRNI